MDGLEIILPIDPNVPSIWTLVGIALALGITPIIGFVGFFIWKSEPISEQEVQHVLRSR